MTDLDASLFAVNFSDVHFEIGRYFDELIPAQKKTKIDIPDVMGYKQLKKKFLPRNIPILGILHADTKAQLITRIETLKEFLYYDDPAQLIFNDKSDRYYLVEYDGKQELQKRGQFVPLRLNFVADDPFGYAVTADDDDETGIVIDGHTWNITNSGQYYAYPVITITMNQNQTHLYIKNNSLSDNRFDITKTMAIGKTLVIDSKNMTIIYDGSDSPAGFGDGGTGSADFILLKTGVNELQIGTDNATIDVSVKTEFRKVYL